MTHMRNYFINNIHKYVRYVYVHILGIFLGLLCSCHSFSDCHFGIFSHTTLTQITHSCVKIFLHFWMFILRFTVGTYVHAYICMYIYNSIKIHACVYTYIHMFVYMCVYAALALSLAISFIFGENQLFYISCAINRATLLLLFVVIDTSLSGRFVKSSPLLLLHLKKKYQFAARVFCFIPLSLSLFFFSSFTAPTAKFKLFSYGAAEPRHHTRTGIHMYMYMYVHMYSHTRAWSH